MSLSDIHNPKAAAELIERFRKRFSAKVCMAPQKDHKGSIVSAHTLSVEAMLRKVAVNSKVYGLKQSKEIAKDIFPIQLQKLGLREVSVFNGFCQKHDVELFSCLENEPFYFQPKQNFMLAYRAVARECYLKRKQFESLPTAEEFGNIHGIEEKIRLSDMALIFQAASIRGAEEVEALKATLDRYLLTGAWNRLITRAIIFPNLPSILATAAFQPFFDMNGTQLQDFENLETEMSHICISLIPLEVGGVAIFSWPDSANSAPKRYYDSIIESQNLTSSVIHAVFDNTENFALYPAWYEQLSQGQKDYLFSRVKLFDSGIEGSKHTRPDNSSPFLDDWGKGIATDF